MLALHPGFAKTATTTLQQGVFPRHRQIHYLGVPATDPALDQLLRCIASEDSTRFEVQAARAQLLPHLSPPPGRTTTLVSHENFTLYEAKDKGMVAQRLLTLFGPCKVMFTLRRQEELLTSWYLQKMGKYMRDGRFLTPKRYFRMKLKKPTRSILDDLDYNLVIASYERLFGPANVAIFPYEQLRADRAGFAGAVAAFLEVDPGEFEQLLAEAHFNPAEAQRRVSASRIEADYLPHGLVDRCAALLPARLHRRVSAYLDAGPRARVQLPNTVRLWVEDHCRTGNCALDQRYGGILTSYGYSL